MNFAGFWIRAVAHLIDFLIWNGVEFGFETLLTKVFDLSSVAEQGVGVVLSFGIAYLYYVELPLRFGTTLGKKLFRIHVVNAVTGGAPSRKTLLVRSVGYLLSYGVLGCGFLMVLFHPQKLALHDLLAKTASIRLKKPIN